ncbi:hypothetical protein GBA52_026994 [Prunus armeniaca]|nr:hypothetical protein GBA52_026994 [Prunus armeniaca]
MEDLSNLILLPAVGLFCKTLGKWLVGKRSRGEASAFEPPFVLGCQWKIFFFRLRTEINRISRSSWRRCHSSSHIWRLQSRSTHSKCKNDRQERQHKQKLPWKNIQILH